MKLRLLPEIININLIWITETCWVKLKTGIWWFRHEPNLKNTIFLAVIQSSTLYQSAYNVKTCKLDFRVHFHEASGRDTEMVSQQVHTTKSRGQLQKLTYPDQERIQSEPNNICWNTASAQRRVSDKFFTIF